jgi:hypothetical protein
MRTKAPIILLTTTALALGACTTSLQTRLDDVEPTETGVDDNGGAIGYYRALRGVTYALPMRQYDIEVKRRLATCNKKIELKVNGATVGLGDDYYLPTLGFELTATATSKLVEGERYLIDYEALTNNTKTTEFKIDYHEGTMLLKSVNASADDQTGEIIAKSIGALAVAAGVVFAPGATASLAAAAVGGAGALKGGRSPASLMGDPDLAPPPPPVSAERLIKDLLKDASDDILAIDCAPAVAATILDRSKASAEIKRLSAGDITAEWKALAIKDKRGRLVKQPLPAGTSLADLNERITALLPYIGIKPVPAMIESELPLLVKWQARVIAELRAKKATRDSLDEGLAVNKKETWPKRAGERRQNNFAELDPADVTGFRGMLDIATQRVVDPDKMATALLGLAALSAAASPGDTARIEFETLEANFASFIDDYLTPDRKSVRTGVKSLRQTPECYDSTAREDACVADELAVSARLIADGVKDDAITAAAPAADVVVKPGDDAGGKPTTLTVVLPPKDERYNVLYASLEATSGVAAPGLFIRPPVMGALRICKGNQESGCPAGDKLHRTDSELMPQLGQLRLLPLENGRFANNGLSVTLAKDGRLSSFAYANKRAIAAAVAASAADAATQGQAFRDAQAKRQTTANEAKIAALKYQIDLDEKQTLADNIGKLADPKSPAQIQAELDAQETTYRKAELVRLITEQCLLRAKAYPDMPTACPAE